MKILRKSMLFATGILFTGSLLLQCGGQSVQEQIDLLIPQVVSYEYGENREHLTAIDSLIRVTHGDESDRDYIEQALIGVLENEQSTRAALQYACEQLSIIGTEDAVPALADLLADEETSDMARYALERIPGEESVAALRGALDTTSGAVKVGIINSLGEREDADAVAQLEQLIQSDNELVASAAATALGKIATPAATDALASAVENTSGRLHRDVLDAYLECADALAEDGNTGRAMEIFNQLYDSSQPTPVRAAALTGLIKNSDNPGERILSVLQDGSLAMKEVAIPLINEVDNISNLTALAGVFNNLQPQTQVQLLTALEEYGDSAVLDVVLEAADSPSDQVSLAAIRALGELGDASTVSLLVSTAASSSGDLEQAARESLYQLNAENVDQTIIDAISPATADEKFELVRAIEQRRIYDAVDSVIETATDQNLAVRMESARVLRAVAQSGHLPEMVDLLANAENDGVQAELERSVIAVAQKIEEPTERGDAVLAKLEEVSNPDVRASLLEVLGSIGDPDGLATLQDALDSDNSTIKSAAIRGLSSWPGTEPASDLLDVAKSAESQTHQILALRGYIQLIGKASDRPADETVSMYQQAMDLAENVNEQRMVLSGLSNMEALAALDMAAKYLEDSAIQQEAAAAAVQIAENIHEDYPERTKEVMARVLEVSGSESVMDDAQDVIDDINEATS
jgi:HEAT repeat protein